MFKKIKKKRTIGGKPYQFVAEDKGKQMTLLSYICNVYHLREYRAASAAKVTGRVTLFYRIIYAHRSNNSKVVLPD